MSCKATSDSTPACNNNEFKPFINERNLNIGSRSTDEFKQIYKESKLLRARVDNQGHFNYEYHINGKRFEIHKKSLKTVLSTIEAQLIKSKSLISKSSSSKSSTSSTCSKSSKSSKLSKPNVKNPISSHSSFTKKTVGEKRKASANGKNSPSKRMHYLSAMNAKIEVAQKQSVPLFTGGVPCLGEC